MLAIKPWRRSLKEVLAGGQLPAEEELKAELIARPVIRFRQQPAMMLIAGSGIVLPPHERLMLWQVALGSPENINVSGRATSKSTAWCVLGATMLSVLVPKRRHVTLSSTGFRGGQNIFNDIERWVTGQWDGQLAGQDFIAASILRGENSRALVHRAQNYWEIKFGSHASMKTLPTNNEDKIRGERAHFVWNDEANTTEESLIAEIVRPFMGVGGGFDGGGDGSTNAIFFTTTIDYGWRPFIKISRAAREGLQRDWEYKQAVKRGDFELQEELRRKGLLKYTYTCFDYTDTILREVQTDREGRQYTLEYPNANELFGRKKFHFQEFELGIPFTRRGASGRVERPGTAVRALKTYPFELDQIERTLNDGSTDESTWLRENRNVIDTATGDVYPHGLMDRVTCFGTQNSIIDWKQMPSAWTKQYGERGFFSPVLYECDDPCVLGVDVADGARDFAAFVVIRIGPLSDGEFTPFGERSLGKTEWSNVVWSEQHRHMSYREIADKIKDFRRRYNLVWYNELWKQEEDHCRAIGLDSGGGGRAVRDALLFLDRPDVERGSDDVVIYDPRDEEEKIQAVLNDKTALPMLDLVKPTDVLYDQLVEFSLGQMKVGRLYIAKWLEGSQRPNRDAKLATGFTGVATLDSQLRKIQQEPTARGRRFFIPSGTTEAQQKRATQSNDPSKKKDSWAAFMYAVKQLRAHLARLKLVTNRPPAAGASVATVNSKRGRTHGRAPGATL